MAGILVPYEKYIWFHKKCWIKEPRLYAQELDY